MNNHLDETANITHFVSMRLGYTDLINRRVTNPEAWQAVHRQLLAAMPTALMNACLVCGWPAVVKWMIAMTESPAMLFAGLGDGLDFDEGARRAGFASRESWQVFRQRFPAWTVWHEAVDPLAPFRLAPTVLRDMLSLVDTPVPLAEIERWSLAQRDEAAEWAIATHLAANGNDDTEVPSRPVFLPSAEAVPG